MYSEADSYADRGDRNRLAGESVAAAGASETNAIGETMSETVSEPANAPENEPSRAFSKDSTENLTGESADVAPDDVAGMANEDSVREGDAGADTEEDFSSDADDGKEIASDPLAEAMASLARLEDELARARADYYNLSQEYSNYVKRAKTDALARYDEGIMKVIDAVLPVLDDVQRAREHDDLSGAPGRIVEKLEQVLETTFKLERFGEVGEPFDPQIHEALMNSSSAEVESEQIGTLIQSGYRLGDKLVRPARVGVLSPE